MRRITLALTVAGVLATAPAALADAPPGPPGCFGDFVSYYAQNPGQIALGPSPTLGAFISTTAQSSVPYGQTEVPFFKGIAPNISGCQ